MDYALLPPEINSGRMYVGPGSASLIAAATAWDGVAAELQSTAAAYSSVISGLAAEWQGPSSTAMTAAAARHVAWISATGEQAEQTATQARAAAAAYETAFAAVVPPPVIAANRSQLASLVATNIVGQNTPAIAITEALYGEMWSQDAAAMYSYADQSAAAATVTPFAVPPTTTNPGGLLGQLLAILESGVSSVGASAQTQFSQLFAAVPTALQSFTSIATSSNPVQGFLSAAQSFAGLQTLNSISADIELIPKLVLPLNDAAISVILSLVLTVRGLQSALPAAAAGNAGAGALAAGLGSAVPAAGTASLTGAAGAAASVGNSGLVGTLSVPPNWAAATPAVRLAAAALSDTSLGAVPAVDGSGNLFSEMALASLVGGAIGGTAPRVISTTTCRGLPVTTNDTATPDQLKHVVAELSQKPESVQHWHTDQDKLESLLAELSKKPGIHAVHLSGHKTKPAPSKSQLP